MPPAAANPGSDRAAVLELIDTWDTDLAAREGVSRELRAAGVLPIDPAGGPCHEDYHRVVDRAPTFVFELDGHIAQVRKIGWAYTSGVVLRRADVVAYAVRRAQ